MSEEYKNLNYSVRKGDVIEICVERFGEIIAYIVDEIKDTTRDLEYPIAIRNSKYLLLRKIDDNDMLTESGDKEGNIVWRLKNDRTS